MSGDTTTPSSGEQEHVLVDTSIYRSDPRRAKPAFRALMRLAKAEVLQLHVPAVVKQEFLSQQGAELIEQTGAISRAAQNISRLIKEADLEARCEEIRKNASAIQEMGNSCATDDFESFLAECAVEHAIQPDHGDRVMEDYFRGAPPFREPKYRKDIPDSFVWQTALDLADKYGALGFISADDGFFKAADRHPRMSAYRTLDEFIRTDSCQDALLELTSAIVKENVACIKALLPECEQELVHSVNIHIVDALVGKTVRHPAIPDDNHEATVVMVNRPDQVIFDFTGIDQYGDGELSLQFQAEVTCSLNYSIFKGEYHTLPDDEAEDISVQELNRHYYEAERSYSLRVEAELYLTIDVSELDENDLSDDELKDAIGAAEHSVDVIEMAVDVPHW